MMRVLYEDNHLVAVYKSCGLLVQADRTGQVCLMDLVREYLREKYKKPGNVFVGLLHRLDKAVDGVVLFAKTSKGAARLCAQIRNRTVIKKYRAILDRGVDPMNGSLRHYLVKNEVKNKSWAYDEPVEGSKEAVLHYKTVKNLPLGQVEVEIDLITGRHHQIRAQFAAKGSPIVGDKKYGSKFEHSAKQGIALTAFYLAFNKATEDEKIVVQI